MVAVVGSVMSVALIIANVLALVVPELSQSQEPTESRNEAGKDDCTTNCSIVENPRILLQ